MKGVVFEGKYDIMSWIVSKENAYFPNPPKLLYVTHINWKKLWWKFGGRYMSSSEMTWLLQSKFKCPDHEMQDTQNTYFIHGLITFLLIVRSLWNLVNLLTWYRTNSKPNFIKINWKLTELWANEIGYKNRVCRRFTGGANEHSSVGRTQTVGWYFRFKDT